MENDKTINIDGADYSTEFTVKYNAEKYIPPKLEKTEFKAFIPGQIIKIFTKKGKKVKAGKVILTFEAMKMINEVTLDNDIVVQEILVKPGDNVEKNQILLKYKNSKKK